MLLFIFFYMYFSSTFSLFLLVSLNITAVDSCYTTDCFHEEALGFLFTAVGHSCYGDGAVGICSAEESESTSFTQNTLQLQSILVYLMLFCEGLCKLCVGKYQHQHHFHRTCPTWDLVVSLKIHLWVWESGETWLALIMFYVMAYIKIADYE